MSATLTTTWVQRSSAAKRLLLSAVAGVGVAVAFTSMGGWVNGALIGWCGFAAVNLGLDWWCIRHANPHETKISVARYDQSSSLMLFTVIAGAAVSVAAIGYLLATSRAAPLTLRIAHILLAVTSIASSWLLMHARFGFHYAHCYYRKYAADGDEPAFNFPGKHAPDYLDFMYFSYVLGMTSQVSDVTINTRAIRRLALLHGLISFAFNLMIVAFFINVVGTVFAAG
jgi:uncharacterized membrane protein